MVQGNANWIAILIFLFYLSALYINRWTITEHKYHKHENICNFTDRVLNKTADNSQCILVLFSQLWRITFIPNDIFHINFRIMKSLDV